MVVRLHDYKDNEGIGTLGLVLGNSENNNLFVSLPNTPLRGSVKNIVSIFMTDWSELFFSKIGCFISAK